MAVNPAVTPIPEWEWIKIADGIKFVSVDILTSDVYYYWTYRVAGGTAPATPTPPDGDNKGVLPDEAVRLFPLDSANALESSRDSDFYIMCANNDEDSDETGSIRVNDNAGKGAASAPPPNPKVPADNFFIQANGPATTLVVDAVFDGKQIQVTDPSDFSIGDVVVITNPASIYFGEALAIVGDIITVDSLLPFAYPAIGSVVQSYTKDMNVDGSITPQVFSIFGPGAPGVKLNVVRIVWNCLTASAVDLSKFGDIVGGVTNGFLMRGVPNPASGLPASNQFNFKTNAELDTITGGDWKPYSATNPAQGQDGYTARYTNGGPDKHDTIPPLITGDRIDAILTDNYTSLSIFRTLFGGNTEFIQ